MKILKIYNMRQIFAGPIMVTKCDYTKMNNTISVLSKLPNLVKELQKLAPALLFKDIILENDYYQLSKSEIVIADIDVLIPEIHNIKQVKWIQTTWAGIDKFLPHLNPSSLESVVISRFSGKHFGRLMSEYVVNNIVNYERNIFQVYENQKQKIWSQKGNILNHRSIGDLTIGILGIGHIGNCIGQILNKFGAKIWGFGRRPTLPESQEYQHYEKYCTKNTLPDLLKNCDYVVNVLPSTNETVGLLNGDILKNCCNKNTVFINIGRGTIISEDDLLKAIDSKWIAAAILDVFENEPLDKESRLWTSDKVFITPHVAGVSRAKDFAETFIDNYNLYRKGEKIPTQFLIGEQY